MADKKISALSSATVPLAGTEVLPIVQSGATVKVSSSKQQPQVTAQQHLRVLNLVRLAHQQLQRLLAKWTF